MLRTRAVEVSLWEAVLPEEVLRLPEELARVDALLDDPVFFAPFVPFFDPRLGRPSTPMEVYLRLMFLKFRYRLGYESLCREVSDSITWRRFCRIPLDGHVPHPTTLMKLTTRCGHRGGGWLQRGAAGQGRRGEAAAHDPAARGHHRGPGRCGLPDRLRAAGQGGAADRRGRASGAGRGRGDPHQGP
jgi:IS5 family transposase